MTEEQREFVRYSPAEMSEFAEEAEEELNELVVKSVMDVAKWFEKWYLKVGHRRLGRILVRIAKEG